MIRIPHILIITLFICFSSARDARRSTFDWNYDGDLTRLVDFSNEVFEDDSKFIIFGSYAAHLASHGTLPYRDIDIVLVDDDPSTDVPIDLSNRTVQNYYGQTIDLKVGSVASLDDLLDAVNINAVSVAFEFQKHGRDDIRLIDNRKDQAFVEFERSRKMRIVEPQKATANDCIRVLSKADRNGFQYDIDDVSRRNCERPQILSSEKAEMARSAIVMREFSNQVFNVEGKDVWARTNAEAEDFVQKSSQQSRQNQRGRRSLVWDSEDPDFHLGYYELGDGKCVTDSGADPSHKYFHGIGEDQCRLKCDHDPACWGFSVSSWGNCLHWMQDDIKQGGASWGDAKCWVAQGVYENGRRSLISAQNLVSKERRLLDGSDAFPLSSGYYDVGLGKCVTTSGEDPAHNYLHGVGEDACRSQCNADSQCFGFSVSIYGNCLHWLTDDLQESGGPSWGGAHCWIAQSVLNSRAGTIERGRRKN